VIFLKKTNATSCDPHRKRDDGNNIPDGIGEKSVNRGFAVLICKNNGGFIVEVLF
jgi:hypothetical protein